MVYFKVFPAAIVSQWVKYVVRSSNTTNDAGTIYVHMDIRWGGYPNHHEYTFRNPGFGRFYLSVIGMFKCVSLARVSLSST